MSSPIAFAFEILLEPFYSACQAPEMLYGGLAMSAESHSVLYRELIWFGIAGPLFGVACALLAKEWGRRQWVWCLLGFFFTMIAVLALIFLNIYWPKKPGTDSSALK